MTQPSIEIRLVISGEEMAQYFRRRLFYQSWCRGYRRAVFFWHGFPADSGKNEDLAEELHRRCLVDVYLLHFAGLGRSHGLFTFLGAFEDALTFVNEITERTSYQSLDMVGHSFGGLVAGIVAHRLGGIDRLVLLAPLVAIPPPAIVREILQQFTSERPDHNFVTLQDECERLRDLKLPNNCWQNLLVLHGKHDSVIDHRLSRAFAEQHSTVSYHELNCDHWFEDRAELCQLVRNFL